MGNTQITDAVTGSKLKVNNDGSINTSGGGGGGGGGAATIADGADVTQGTSTDANTVASVMGRLTKIRDLLNATLSVNIANGNANGQTTMANSAPVTLANNQSAVPTTDTNSAAMKTDLDTVVTNTNKIPASPAQEGGNLASIKTDLDTVVTNTNKIPASPAQEGGNLATIATNTTNIATAANQTTVNTNTSNTATGVGAVADAAYTSGSGSIIAVLKGVFTRLANIVTIAFDNTSRLQISNYGKNSAAGDTAIQVNSDGSQYMDVRRIGGTTYSNTNPFVTETNIQNWIRNGQGYKATTGRIAESTAKTIPFSLFNPSASGKSILIYSFRVYWNTGTSTAQVAITSTTDPGPGLTSAVQITPLNAKPGGAASVASVYYTTTSTTYAGTNFDAIPTATNMFTELFTNGDMYLLPSGAANGLEMFLTTTTGSGSYSFTTKWIEF